jgi:hypothetical protein
MYNPITNNGERIWIPGLPKGEIQAFPFTMPDYPCELVTMHASDVAHAPGPWLTAHYSTVPKILGAIDPTKTGNPEAILAYATNVHGKGAVTAMYIAPGARAHLNVGVAANMPHPEKLGPKVVFALQTNIVKL